MRPLSPDLRRLFTVAVLLTGVKVAGAVKSLVCVRAFGISRELDCYLVAFALISLVCDTVAGSLTPALIPSLANDTDRRSSYGGVLYCSCGLLAAGALVLANCDWPIYRILAAGFSHSDLTLTHKLLLLMTPVLPLTAATAVFRAVLNTENKFSVAAAAPMLTPLAIFVLILFAARSYGVAIVAVGTTAGCAGEFLVLACTLRYFGYSVLPRPSLKLPDAWLSRSYLPILASNFVGATRAAVDAAVAASLGPGSVAALNLGTRLVAVVSSIGPASISTVLLPSLSSAAALHDWRALRRRVCRVSAGGAALGLLIALVVCLFSRPIASLAFQKGASLHVSIPALARIQSVSFTQLPFVFVLAVLTRAALARRYNRLLFGVSVVTAAANLLLDIVCARLLGTAGVVLATTLVNALSCVLLLPVMLGRSDLTGYLQNVRKKTPATLYADSRVSK